MSIKINETKSCLDRNLRFYNQDLESYQHIPVKVNPNAHSETLSNDDGESIQFSGFGNINQTSSQSQNWAERTNELARKSIFFHIFEFPLKIISYAISHSQYSDSTWSRIFFALERTASTLGGMFRNKFYGQKDDNLGAEERAMEVFGDKATYNISRANNIIQTKFRFLIPIIGLFNPSLANDIDSGIVGSLASSWWRNMSMNSGFYTGIYQDFLIKYINMILRRNSESTTVVLPSLTLVKKQLLKHWDNAKASLREFEATTDTKQNNERKTKSSILNIIKSICVNHSPYERTNESLLAFCKHADQVTSIIMPFLCIPSNIFGDTLRPIARRLNLTGFSRSFIRMLSVADRGILGINYLFRFFIPEKISENEQTKNNNPAPIKFSNFYLGSLIGDILDLPLTMFEDKIKESSGLIQHSVEIMRIIKDTMFNIFWSGRRIRITQKVLEN